MKALTLILIAVASALIVGVLIGWFAREFLAVDACLDAGGAWIGRGYCAGLPVQ